MSQVFSTEEELPHCVASRSAGEIPQISMPPGFPDDPQWRSWPGQLFAALLEPGCPVDPLQTARITAEAMSGQTDSLGRELLLPHLKHRPHTRRGREGKRKAPILHLLFSMLQQEGGSSWRSAREYISRATKAEELIHYLDPDYAADYVYFETRGYYRNFLGDSGIHEEQRYLETTELYREACLLPLVQNYLGAASLLGILEVRYGTSESPYTPWAGITKFRLTDWGRYVTGIQEKVPVWKPRRVLEFSASGEIVSLRESSPGAEKFLREIAGEIAPGIFRLGRSQILAAAATEAELGDIIDRLLTMAIEPVPVFWTEMFESLDNSIVRLEEASGYLVFQVPDHSSILSLLREEPSLARLASPAAGRKILIHREDLPGLRRELKKRGLLLEIGRV